MTTFSTLFLQMPPGEPLPRGLIKVSESDGIAGSRNRTKVTKEEESGLPAGFLKAIKLVFGLPAVFGCIYCIVDFRAIRPWAAVRPGAP